MLVSTIFIYTMLNVTLVGQQLCLSVSLSAPTHPDPFGTSFFGCMQETTVADEYGRISEDSSSDGDKCLVIQQGD